MDFNKCPYCGGEVTDLHISLTGSEEKDWEYANSLINNAETALNPNIINKLDFKDDNQVYAYFSAVFDQLAKGNFLRWSFLRDWKKNHNLDKSVELIIVDGMVFQHGNI